MGIYKVFVQTNYSVRDVCEIESEDPIDALNQAKKMYYTDSYAECVGVRKASVQKPKVGTRNDVLVRLRRGRNAG